MSEQVDVEGLSGARGYYRELTAQGLWAEHCAGQGTQASCRADGDGQGRALPAGHRSLNDGEVDAEQGCDPHARYFYPVTATTQRRRQHGELHPHLAGVTVIIAATGWLPAMPQLQLRRECVAAECYSV